MGTLSLVWSTVAIIRIVWGIMAVMGAMLPLGGFLAVPVIGALKPSLFLGHCCCYYYGSNETVILSAVSLTKAGLQYSQKGRLL